MKKPTKSFAIAQTFGTNDAAFSEFKTIFGLNVIDTATVRITKSGDRRVTNAGERRITK